MAEADILASNGVVKSRNHSKRSAPKVRTGCQTCRQRRIKCDETRPECNRCVRASKNCCYSDQFVVLVTGYDRPHRLFDRGERSRLIANNRNAGPRSLTPRYGTAEEARYLNIFVSTVAPWTGRYSHQSFFGELLPRSSWHHSAIRHALVSVAMAFEHYTQMPISTTRPDRHTWHYNRALSHLYTESKVDSRVLLISCALFWLHDNLMNNARAALIHLKGFLNIMISAKNEMVEQNQSYELEQTIYQNLVFWGHSADPAFAELPDVSMIATIRAKLADPYYTRARHSLVNGREEAFLCVYSMGWAIEEIEVTSNQNIESTITFEELQTFVERWYLAYSTQPNVSANDHTILACWYLCFCAVIYARRYAPETHDPYIAKTLETLLVKLESVYCPDFATPYLLEEEPIMPVIPLVTEVIRMAINTDMRARAFAVLQNLKRFETFWNSDIVAMFLSSITWDESYEAKRISTTKVTSSINTMDLQDVEITRS